MNSNEIENKKGIIDDKINFINEFEINWKTLKFSEKLKSVFLLNTMLHFKESQSSDYIKIKWNNFFSEIGVLSNLSEKKSEFYSDLSNLMFLTKTESSEIYIQSFLYKNKWNDVKKSGVEDYFEINIQNQYKAYPIFDYIRQMKNFKLKTFSFYLSTIIENDFEKTISLKFEYLFDLFWLNSHNIYKNIEKLKIHLNKIENIKDYYFNIKKEVLTINLKKIKDKSSNSLIKTNNFIFKSKEYKLIKDKSKIFHNQINIKTEEEYQKIIEDFLKTNPLVESVQPFYTLKNFWTIDTLIKLKSWEYIVIEYKFNSDRRVVSQSIGYSLYLSKFLEVNQDNIHTIIIQKKFRKSDFLMQEVIKNLYFYEWDNLWEYIELKIATLDI